MDEAFSSVDNLSLTLNLTTDEYGFFAYPAALGKATFTDRGNGFQGGWNGANWDLEHIATGPMNSPIVTSIEGSKWFIYRTDHPGHVGISFSVEFENNELETGDSAGCDLAEFPHVSTGSVVGDDLTIVRIFVAGGTETQLAEGIVEEEIWTINTTYFYLAGSDSPDLNRFNAEGLYDMYFYSSDGTEYGPFSIIIEDGEITNESFDTTQ